MDHEELAEGGHAGDGYANVLFEAGTWVSGVGRNERKGVRRWKVRMKGQDDSPGPNSNGDEIPCQVIRRAHLDFRRNNLQVGFLSVKSMSEVLAMAAAAVLLSVSLMEEARGGVFRLTRSQVL